MAIVPRQVFPWETRRSDEEEENNEGWGNDGGALFSRGAGQQQPGVRYMDLILPPPGFSVWDMPQNKLQTTAVALTFVATACLVTFLAGAGMLAILVTGFVVSAAVLLLVTVCTALVALIVTGVPIGYATWQLVSRYQQFKMGFGDGGHHDHSHNTGTWGVDADDD